MFKLKTVLRQQRLALAICLAALLPACSEPAPEKTDGDTAFVGVSVVDVVAGEIRPAQTVVITGDRISAILPVADASLADGVEIVDATGRYLSPGLMDMHTHPVAEVDLAIALSNGVTTLRVMWGNPEHLRLRGAIESGEIPGPRMILGGDLIDGDPPIWADMGLPAKAYTDPDAMDAMVAGQKAAGYDFVKTYSRLTPEVFSAILKAGEKHGIEISGHVPQTMPIRDAIAGGMRTSEHFIGVLSAVLADESLPNPDVSPFFPDAIEFMVQVGKGEIDPDTVIDWDKVTTLAEWAAQQEHWFVPTHDIMRNFTENGQKPPADVSRYMTVEEQALFQVIEDGSFFKLQPEQRRGESIMYELRTQVLKAFHDAGAKVLAGTDHGRLSGLFLVDEIKALHKAGFSKAAAIRAATSEPGSYLGRAGELGIVAEGATADLVLLASDPLADLDALRDVRGVMSGGQWYGREKLDAILDDIAARMAGEAE